MAEVNPDVLACMHAIHTATNDGTFDKDTINAALKKLHDYLTGAAYEGSFGRDAQAQDVEADGDDDHAHARKRKKK